jgi:hypothetical protein
MEGYRVASGPSKDDPYGSLEKQIPLFKEYGLDLTRFYYGTLNISIAPYTFEMIAPEYTFRQVNWTDLHLPEDFSFSACSVRFMHDRYAGYVYYPHPETKKTPLRERLSPGNNHCGYSEYPLRRHGGN